MSGSLVLHGEAGIGKTALLEHVRARITGARFARATGTESETELAFAGLHQLCAPFVNRLDHLPPPQREALETAFGRRSGPSPDGFLVGLAALGLLSDAAKEQPVVCLVDDAQSLDAASAQVFGFVARRMTTEALVMIFAVRDPDADQHFAGLPRLAVEALSEADARDLLASAVPGRLDEGVRDRMVAEAAGNPQTLLELPRAWTLAELAGGFGHPHGRPASQRVAEKFERSLAALPDDTRLLLLVAASTPAGDAALIWRAAERLDVRVHAMSPAIAAGLLRDGTDMRFRHPLIRSLIYSAATPDDRKKVHAALAGATDSSQDPDRRAWHLAAAEAGPNEEVALELETSAAAAQARGGIGAAAAFLERSFALTGSPAKRTDRALAAAQTSLHAGQFDRALELLASARATMPNDLQRARADHLRGQIAFAAGVSSDAPSLLLDAARRFAEFDTNLARETYLEAWGAAVLAGDAASSGVLADISRAARSAPPSTHPPRACDLLLDGLATLVTDGRRAAAPVLRGAASAILADEGPIEQNLRWGWLTTVPSAMLWDADGWLAINARQLELARDVGALARLPIDLTSSAILAAWSGNFASAAAAIDESTVVTKATGTRNPPYAALLLAALRGDELDVIGVMDARSDAIGRAQGLGSQYAHWAGAVLFNGMGRYGKAVTAAKAASDATPDLFVSQWALVELIEAAARTGDDRLALEGLERLRDACNASESDWAHGVEARSRALTSEGNDADGLYREAIERLSRTGLRTELARAHLLYGEWLRRQARRIDARGQLRSAHELFGSIGMKAFADRAGRELQATGETVRKRSVETVDELTTQELQIARLASGGLTNPEIAAQLFLSPRTVEWHLRHVFSKLGVASRRQLGAALSPPAQPPIQV